MSHLLPVTSPLLEVRDLSRSYALGAFGSRRVSAVAGVTFSLARGEALAVVGESGSGKSTLSRLLLRLERPDTGQMVLDGTQLDLRSPAGRDFRAKVQLVFQDPFGSLNPRDSVLEHLEGPLALRSCSDLRAAAARLLEEVGLSPAADFLDKRPHALSGGQRQRVAIARALAPGPALLVADEPTSMLDVSLRMGILNLLVARKQAGLGLILITHDLAAARYVAERVLVLLGGQPVELGHAEDVLAAPRHPYTRLLRAAAARGHAPGHAPDPAPDANPAASPVGAGCVFASRCPHAFADCAVSPPPDVVVAPGHVVRCHLAQPQPEVSP